MYAAGCCCTSHCADMRPPQVCQAICMITHRVKRVSIEGTRDEERYIVPVRLRIFLRYIILRLNERLLKRPPLGTSYEW